MFNPFRNLSEEDIDKVVAAQAEAFTRDALTHAAVSASIARADGLSAEAMAHRIAGQAVYRENNTALDD